MAEREPLKVVPPSSSRPDFVPEPPAFCTVHQRVDASGFPRVRGSEVRLPTGESIPQIQRVSIEALPGDLWRTTLELITVFGPAIVDPPPLARPEPAPDDEHVVDLPA